MILRLVGAYLDAHIFQIHLVSSNLDSLGETPCPNFGFFRILGPYLIYNRGIDIAADLEYILSTAVTAVDLGPAAAAFQDPPPPPRCISSVGYYQSQ